MGHGSWCHDCKERWAQENGRCRRCSKAHALKEAEQPRVAAFNGKLNGWPIGSSCRWEPPLLPITRRDPKTGVELDVIWNGGRL